MDRLTIDLIHQLFPKGIERSFSKGQIVCYDGDQPNHVFFVIEGHVKYYDIDTEGNEKVLHINGPRNGFPMIYTFDVETEVKGFYSCIDKTRLLIVPMGDFHEVVRTNIEFSNMMLTWFLVEIQELVYRLNGQERTDARYKVLFALKNLSRYYGQAAGGWMLIDFPITRQFMADYTGLARETVSIAMSELEKEKTIKQGKGRTIEVKVSALPPN